MQARKSSVPAVPERARTSVFPAVRKPLAVGASATSWHHAHGCRFSSPADPEGCTWGPWIRRNLRRPAARQQPHRPPARQSVSEPYRLRAYLSGVVSEMDAGHRVAFGAENGTRTQHMVRVILGKPQNSF